MLKRKIEKTIINYLNSNSNKIMIIDGARQIGKSFIIRYVATEILKSKFTNYIEINFVEDSLSDRLFSNINNKEDFYLQLSMIAGDKMKYEAYMEEYVDLVKRFTEAQDKYNKLMAEQVDRNRQSIKLQAFINEIKATDTLNLEFNDKLFNLTIINIKVYKDSHLEFNFKDGSVINIEL